ncbi:MAG: SusC/RagA family TonB-linked outer membrane protein [Bacteroidetes bacterium GWC2_40_13]|nr:MAG: SusC/RagA family TonB-linked outer membrane protein [Bacteroidetes bacterium GWC2_40_13]
MLGIQLVNAQQKTITGTVTSSEDGMSLPGVSVAVKGTTVGTITNINGQYSLGVSADAQTLVYSFVGMKTQEVAIGATNVIDVVLEPEVIGVDEVVVTALGIKRSEKALGYATQALGGEELTKAPEPNIVNSLGGRISGVQITNSSGAVGASSRIILRGASTIFGDNQPLFVVDGVPMSNTNDGTAGTGGGFDVPNGVADINPNDIEKLDVLKGPNASALYGIRAANGVIVITTKKGKQSQAIGIDVSSSITFENPLVLPNFQNSYGQGPNKDFFDYGNGTNGDGGVDESWGPPLDRGLSFMQFTSYINNPENPQPEPWVSHPDNVKNFYETGITTKHDISMSGGNETSTFRLGAGYSNLKGMVPFTDYIKTNVNASASHKFTDKISANFNVNYANSYSNNLPSGGYDGSNVVQQTIWSGRNVDIAALKDWKNLPKALPGSSYGAGTLPINWNTQFQNNPYWQLETNTNEYNRDRVFGNFGIGVDFTSWLNLTANVGLDQYTTNTNTRLAKGSAADAPTYAISGGTANRDGSEGYYDERVTKFMETNMDMMLGVKKDLNDDMKVSLNIGGNRMYQKNSFDMRAIQLELPDLYNLNNKKAGTSIYNKNDHEGQAINSIYGAGEISFKEYLFLNITGRNDWASVLPSESNSFFYPSVTLSAVLSDMIDMKSFYIDLLKVRGGWAKVGGFGPLEPSAILAVYELSELPWDGSTFANFPTTLSNSKVKPQTTTSYEGGIQAAMFGNKLRLDVTLYDQTNKDLILPVQVTRSSGVYKVWDNVGELRNRGVEIQLGTTLYEDRANDLAVDLDFNFAKNNNEVIKAGKDDSNDDEALVLGGQWNMDLQVREGYAYGVIVGPSLARTENGDVIYSDGLPQVGETKVLGDIQPDWTGGVNLTVKFKGITLSSLIDAKMGGEIYTMTNAWGQYSGILEESLIGRETGIVGDGVMLDANGNYVANNVVVTAENYNHNAFGNDIVETSVFDASYVKWRQLSIGYDLPVAWVSKLGLKNANISFIGRNLAILYKKAPHIDPETGFSNENNMQGMEFGQMPSTRSLGFSLNLKF